MLYEFECLCARTDFLRNAKEVGSDRKSTRLNSSHLVISYAVFCLKKKKTTSPDRVIRWTFIPKVDQTLPTYHIALPVGRNSCLRTVCVPRGSADTAGPHCPRYSPS